MADEWVSASQDFVANLPYIAPVRMISGFLPSLAQPKGLVDTPARAFIACSEAELKPVTRRQDDEKRRTKLLTAAREALDLCLGSSTAAEKVQLDEMGKLAGLDFELLSASLRARAPLLSKSVNQNWQQSLVSFTRPPTTVCRWAMKRSILPIAYEVGHLRGGRSIRKRPSRHALPGCGEVHRRLHGADLKRYIFAF
ncbi:hypothetical protein [Rhizobium lentis]|uniref:Uncharacterized protein n=1 Tax=Rhizobium lentis TaxID=1138194 RepID=A0A7W8UK77_9HYPH|nr:hypothetical protein [Rhizobium lentis]MBB4571877.1 hypothetical protein [Rhizobium lentis]MBB5548932.1 hypothetical protein [Rhizobium lentis]MBB5559465.1 hypothetical protein [Rhizobium lentis]MBB5565013.1 hypothetical protein [Rhizobium lentis]